jgi:O-antigen/teichoic acid export membrane protein
MDLFGLLFDESKLEAGRYAQILIPWFFTVLIVMPLSFVPDLFKRQKTAMFIDGVKLLLRMAGLAMGVMSENVYIALAMFSGVSTLVNIYSLLWYIRLIRKNE